MDPSSTLLAADSPFVDPDEVQDESGRSVALLQVGEDAHSDASISAELGKREEDDEDARPHAPYLRPTIPGLSSTVSSLSASRGVSVINQLAQSTPLLIGNEKPPETDASSLQNHTLIQMLNLVGNRFLEAEGNGMLPLQPEQPLSSGERRAIAQSQASLGTNVGKRGMFGSAIDEESTPRGGRSPLTVSLSNVEAVSLRTPASQRFVSQTMESPSTSSHSPFGSQEFPIIDDETSKPVTPVASSTESSQSDVSATTGMQVSIHALSTAVEPASDRLEQLASRLKAIFKLDREEEIVSCHPCWLFRGVMLQGYIYILASHVCFYAYLPSREDRVLKAGILRKKTRRTHRFSRHWAVLRGRSLSWYESNRDPYFPQDHIDLRNVLGVEVAEDARFTVETPYRGFIFEADSREGAQDWVNVLKRSIFRAQNEGESVRISIPYEAILDVDGSDASSLSPEWAGQSQDMVSIKVVNSATSQSDYSMDEYFFLNLINPSNFIEELRGKLLEYAAAQTATRPKLVVRDSTSSINTVTTQPIAIPFKKPGDTNVTVAPGLESQLAEAVNFSSTPTISAIRTQADQVNLSSSVRTIKSSSSSTHGYPPSPTSRSSANSSVSWERKSVLPQWVKEASSRLNTTYSENWFNFANKISGRSVRESWSVPPFSKTEEATEGEKQEKQDLAESNSSLFSVLEAPEREGELIEADAIRQFRECFSLPDSENLLGHLSASLYRVLPVTGCIYISTNYVCYRSSRLASKTMGRTLMILPKQEIISIAKNNAFRYGHHGLVVVIRGHEEIFLEFASALRRDQCISLIEMQLKSDDIRSQDANQPESLLLTDLGPRRPMNKTPSEAASEDSPMLFNSASSASAFLSSKPKDNLHITFLTIGSRGDVQPYIAFAKGLKQEGHSVRIATHKEFQAWIESYDIEFKEVGGDPAELMRICVENGTFTVAFLRESMTKFRGWLDDLLISCWNACQGTDVVVESPSAIAGIHVAEALQVPYYRSFTMPWTRTRVYPHAFAVPGHKAGGNYNYMSYVIFDQVFWRASAGQINNWRRDCLGLKATTFNRLEQHKVPFLYNFSPYLVPKPIDWYDWIHVTGFWFLDHADETGNQGWTPPSDLVDFIARAKESGRKLVYVGWGSIVVSDAQAMTRTVTEAIKKSGVCAIVSKGWSDRLQQTEIKEEESHPDIFTIESIPHDWLFPQLDAACHHGGSGTLGASLRAGIPTIVKPYFGDQFFWASQVESLHIGSFVRNFNRDTFAEALQVCTRDVKMIENAKKIGKVIRAEDGVSNAIRAFYGDWDYACSRIPRDGRLINTTSRGVDKFDIGDKVQDKAKDIEEDDDGWSVVGQEEDDDIPSA